ncbi:hypothetical protein [Trichloromonas sp.]|uniref:hypothetical protein n=1 Tax=Trichloromonas sp. TaxID=3069249 RepID=UPI002A4434D0|nr:hypothetical protein [Trichloromonas sp.]
MTKTVFGARLIQKYSDETTVVPTISTLTDDHTQGWLPTDIYKGELFLNIADNKMWVRTEDTSYIPEVVLADNEGKIPMRFIPNLIAGTGTVTDIFIGGGLSAIDLSSSPISNLQTAGTIMLGVPSSITSTTINETTSNSHTHKFVPAGSDSHIQYKMSDNLVSSSALRFDGESLYISGTTSQSTSHMLYFDQSNGKITYGGVQEGFIHPYQDLGYLISPYVVNWNINDGFNYVVTSPSSFTLNMTNLTNGASGNLIIIPETTSINVTISTCTDTGSNSVLKRINGSLTGLTSSIGRYILSWTCSIIGESKYIHFNMSSYPSLP